MNVGSEAGWNITCLELITKSGITCLELTTKSGITCLEPITTLG